MARSAWCAGDRPAWHWSAHGDSSPRGPADGTSRPARGRDLHVGLAGSGWRRESDHDAPASKGGPSTHRMLDAPSCPWTAMTASIPFVPNRRCGQSPIPMECDRAVGPCDAIGNEPRVADASDVGVTDQLEPTGKGRVVPGPAVDCTSRWRMISAAAFVVVPQVHSESGGCASDPDNCPGSNISREAGQPRQG